MVFWELNLTEFIGLVIELLIGLLFMIAFAIGIWKTVGRKIVREDGRQGVFEGAHRALTQPDTDEGKIFHAFTSRVKADIRAEFQNEVAKIQTDIKFEISKIETRLYTEIKQIRKEIKFEIKKEIESISNGENPIVERAISRTKQDMINHLIKGMTDTESYEFGLACDLVKSGFNILDAYMVEMFTRTKHEDADGNEVIMYESLPPGLKALMKLAEKHMKTAAGGIIGNIKKNINSAVTDNPMQMIQGLMSGDLDMDSIMKTFTQSGSPASSGQVLIGGKK